jgi:hypothetical protein
MTLSTLDFKAVRDDILTLIRANTTTLNTGLTAGTFTSTTEQIKPGDPFSNPQPMSLYPSIFVKIGTKEEDWQSMGNRKQATLTFSIFAMTVKVENDPDAEIMLLAKNIESVIRDNVQFSTYILMSKLASGDFGDGDINGVYAHVYRVNLECVVRME